MIVVIVLVILIVLVTVILIFGGREQRLENRRIEKERKLAEKNAKREIKEREKEIKKSKDTYVDILKPSTEENINDIESMKESTNEENANNLNEDPDITFLFDDLKEDNKKNDNISDTLDRYIKEAQSKDIGYLNGDDPDNNEEDMIKGENEDTIEETKIVEEKPKASKKKTTTKKASSTKKSTTTKSKTTTRKSTTKTDTKGTKGKTSTTKKSPKKSEGNNN